MEEEEFENVRVPKGKPFVLCVFKSPDSAIASIMMPANIDATQLQVLGCYFSSRADYILKRAWAIEDAPRIKPANERLI